MMFLFLTTLVRYYTSKQAEVREFLKQKSKKYLNYIFDVTEFYSCCEVGKGG